MTRIEALNEAIDCVGTVRDDRCCTEKEFKYCDEVIDILSEIIEEYEQSEGGGRSC